MKKYLLSSVLALLAFPSFGCEPGAPGDETHPIAINLRIGLILALVSTVLLAAIAALDLGRWKRKWLSFLYLLLVPIHPYWWMSVYGGDCGYTMRNWALYYTIVVGCYVIARSYQRVRDWKSGKR